MILTILFTGVLISDGLASYAVFTYKCGGMEWGGGVISWQASTSEYGSHMLSGLSNSNDVGCLNRDSSNYTSIVYRLDIREFLFCKSIYMCCAFVKVHVLYMCIISLRFPASCEDNEFLCDNGKCILKCDLNGDDDCGDNSDERGCGSMYMYYMEVYH